MAHLHSACPICNTTIIDCTKENCHKCGWILEIEGLLNPKIYDSLLNWATQCYDRVQNLEGKSKYDLDLLNNRLYRHKEEIDLLKQQMESIFAHFPEINSTLGSKEINIDSAKRTLREREDNNPIAVVTESDRNLLATVPDSNNIESGSILPEQEQPSLEVTKLPQVQQEIASEYYHNLTQFATKYQVKTANVTKDSINYNRGNEEKIVILEETHRGNYWIFSYDEYIYLVPAEDKYINQHSYTIASTIFEGHNYTPDYQKIQLLKPAIVSIDTTTNPQTWRLQQQGKLAFS